MVCLKAGAKLVCRQATVEALAFVVSRVSDAFATAQTCQALLVVLCKSVQSELVK